MEKEMIREPGLWNRSYLLFVIGSAQTVFGSTLTAVAMSFLVLELTGSAAATGLTLALATLPNVCGPLAGTLIDRMSLRIPLVVGDLLQGALALITWFLATNNRLPIEFVYVSAFLSGVISVFYRPAAEALLPSLVPRQHLVRAGGILRGTTQAVTLMGYGLSGLIVTRYGVEPALLIDAVSFLIMGLLFLTIAMPPVASDPSQQTFLQDLNAGLMTLREQKILGAVVVIGFVVMAAMAPLNMLLPKLSLDLGLAAHGYSASMMALTIGLLIGTAGITWIGSRLRPRLAVGMGLTTYAVFYTLLAFAEQFWSLALLAFLLGLGMSATQAGTMYLVQTLTPPHQLGRVFSVVVSAMMLALPLTLLVLSTFADQVQPRFIFLCSAAVLAACTAGWLLVVRRPAPVRPSASEPTRPPSPAEPV